jgi:multimeric flavodoxin WrbA
MKTLLINGSPRAEGCTYTALREMCAVLNKEGIDTEILHVGKGAIEGCRACGSCRKNGACVVDDLVNSIGSRIDEFDAIVLGSPVYYAGPSGQIQAFCDRLFYTYGRKMAGKVGASIVSCRRGGASAAFDRLNKYFSISNMPIASSQYWNQVHGNTPDEVVQDLEGMQTMRVLARNMAWMMKCFEAGRNAGIPLPEQEEVRIFTNYIR